jgi:hypothetical protein
MIRIYFDLDISMMLVLDCMVRYYKYAAYD